MEATKQNNNKNSEFEKLLSEDLVNRQLVEGKIIKGTVTAVGKKLVWVDIKAKSEGAIDIQEFILTKEIDKIKTGSTVDVLLEKIEDRHGNIRISREKARRQNSLQKLRNALEKSEEVTGTIVGRTKGGAVVDINSCLAFLPGSQFSDRPIKSLDGMMNTPLKFNVLSIDDKRSNIIVSRRKVLEKKNKIDRDKIIKKLKVGQIVNGTVKNIVSYGAFIDIGGIDSLMHLTDFSFSRIDSPSDLLSVGDNIKVVITKIDESSRVSVSLKNLQEDPFKKHIEKYKVGQRIMCEVSKVVEYGVFCKFPDHELEGLCHQSHMHHTKKTIHPGKLFSTSQKVEMEIIEIDSVKRRIALSHKACIPNPWTEFKKNYKVGDECEAAIKAITTYAIFATIKGTELDLMCHQGNISWTEKDSDLKNFKKKQIQKFKILSIDEEKQQIRGGIRELTPDFFVETFGKKKVGDVVTAIVDHTSKDGVHVYVGNKNFLILIKKAQLSKDPQNQRISRFTPGMKIDALITDISSERRKVSLSIKNLEERESKEVLEKFGHTDSGAKLADIFNFSPILKKKKPKTKK